MADLLVVGFPTLAKAEAVRRTLVRRYNKRQTRGSAPTWANEAGPVQVTLDLLLQPTNACPALKPQAAALAGLLFTIPSSAAPDLGAEFMEVAVDDHSTTKMSTIVHSGKAILFLLTAETVTDDIIGAFRGVVRRICRSRIDEAKHARLRIVLGRLGAVARSQTIQQGAL